MEFPMLTMQIESNYGLGCAQILPVCGNRNLIRILKTRSILCAAIVLKQNLPLMLVYVVIS